MPDFALSERMRHIERELTTQFVGHPTRVLDTVDSTNRAIKALMMEGSAPHGTALWADAQTAGRGRLGRVWSSPAGSHLYTSILLRPPQERVTGILSLLAGVAVIRAVRQVTGLDARMKWPNDGVVQGKKFCGVLVEAGMAPNPWAILGMGINVLGDPSPDFPHATTLHRVLKKPLVREELWVRLMMAVEQVYNQWLGEGDAWVISEWTRYNATIGFSVRVDRPGQDSWIGMAEAIDGDGGLWVCSDERREKVISGEVSLRLANGRYAPESF